MRNIVNEDGEIIAKATKEGTLIGGHHRIMLAGSLGQKAKDAHDAGGDRRRWRSLRNRSAGSFGDRDPLPGPHDRTY